MSNIVWPEEPASEPEQVVQTAPVEDAVVIEDDPIGSVLVENAPEEEQQQKAVPVPKPVNRRLRGGLESSVKAVCDAFSEDKITLDAGQLLTPHRIRKLIAEREGVHEPSGGAVSNILKVWADVGAALLNDKPLAFLSYTEAAIDLGIAQLKVDARDARKTSSTPAAVVPEPEPEPEVAAAEAEAENDAEVSVSSGW